MLLTGFSRIALKYGPLNGFQVRGVPMKNRWKSCQNLKGGFDGVLMVMACSSVS